jgi:hypothetical protein
MADKKPLTKMEWMRKELASDDYHPSNAAIEKVIAGEDVPFEPALVDYIMDLEVEWRSRPKPSSSTSD